MLADPRGDGGPRGAGSSRRERPVDLVYRRAVLSELVEREDEVRAFLGAYRDGLRPFVNSFRCRLSEDKAFFAILTDEAFAAPDDRRGAGVRGPRSCPGRAGSRSGGRARAGARSTSCRSCSRTARGSSSSPPTATAAARSSWEGETAPAEWEAAVRAALDAPWVVQERVEIPEEPFPVFEGGALGFASLKVNANPFYVAASRWAP